MIDKTLLHLRPYDVITITGCDEGWPNICGERKYEVCSIQIGGLNQENMIGLRSWSQIPGTKEEMLVPEFMLAGLAEVGRMKVARPMKVMEK